MADEGFDAEEWDAEEWDADFLDQIVQAEELALSAQSSQRPPPPPPPPPIPTTSWSPPPVRRLPPPPELSYSPPRELSQRPRVTRHTDVIHDFVDSFAPHGIDIAKETELGRLQKELNRVSEQLSHLEKECSELRKERDTSLEQLKVLNSRIDAKDSDVNLTKNMEMVRLRTTDPQDTNLIGNILGMALFAAPWLPGYQQLVKMDDRQIKSRVPGQNVACDTGRDQPAEVSTSASHETCFRSEKLLGLWNPNDRKQGRILVAELYKICEEDFHVLFGCMNSPGNGSSTASPDQHFPFHPLEYAKVLHLHSVFTKISNDCLRSEDLLDALVDLCNLKNVFIAHWSVRVLHKILRHSFGMGKEFCERENVTVEESISGNIEYDTNGSGNDGKDILSFANVEGMLKQGQIPSALKLSISKTPDISWFSNHIFAASVSGVYLMSLFERMCLIATESNDEQTRFEALSIMNLILMRHNAYLERDKFAGELVFRSLSKLLRREAGFSVQDRAVQTLFLLCNCPKVITMISSCLKEDGEHAFSKDLNSNSFPTFQGLNDILIGLADCVACYGSDTTEEMDLRRNAIFFLAFLGSSGKSGFEILLNHRLPKGTNFLAVILQSMSSDLDLQASKAAKRSGIIMEQSLLIREVLILLNRLVSHPQYSVRVLKALTVTRDMASMTVDVANRLTQKSKFLWQVDNTTKQSRESEILDLARVFKKRVFTFLGDHIS